MRSDRAAVAAALVHVRVPDGTGSGVAVQTPEGVRILTCEHVVRGHDVVTVIMRTEAEGEFVFTEAQAEIVRFNKKWDLALLRIDDEAAAEVTPLQVAKQEPDLYEPILLGACPNGLFGVVLDGLMQGTSDALGEAAQAGGENLFSGLFVPGSSGGAVADMGQELVGIITNISRDEGQYVHPLGYAAPLRVLRRFALQRPRRLAVVKATVEFTPDFDLQDVPACHEFQPMTTRWEECQVCHRDKGDPIHD